MDESGAPDDVPAADQPSVDLEVGHPGAGDARLGGAREDALAPSETFQLLASEVRVSVLLELLAAERRGAGARSFSALQAAAGEDSSAGFAYHLRQLDDYFVRKTDAGYVLTPAGRRTAEAVVDGTFTVADGPGSDDRRADRPDRLSGGAS